MLVDESSDSPWQLQKSATSVQINREATYVVRDEPSTASGTNADFGTSLERECMFSLNWSPGIRLMKPSCLLLSLLIQVGGNINSAITDSFEKLKIFFN